MNKENQQMPSPRWHRYQNYLTRILKEPSLNKNVSLKFETNEKSEVSKEIEDLSTIEVKMLKLKNTMHKIKNSLKELNSRTNMMEERNLNLKTQQ